MTIRIGCDFSSFMVGDDHRSYKVHLDPADDWNEEPLCEGHLDWKYPAFMAEPGFSLAGDLSEGNFD